MQYNNIGIICQLVLIATRVQSTCMCLSDKDRLATKLKYAPNSLYSCRCLDVLYVFVCIATVNRKVYVLTRQLCIHTYVRTMWVFCYNIIVRNHNVISIKIFDIIIYHITYHLQLLTLVFCALCVKSERNEKKPLFYQGLLHYRVL